MTKKEISFKHQLIPVLFFLGFIAYGLGLRQFVFNQEPLPIEIIMLISSVVVSIYVMLFAGIKWEEIQKKVFDTISEALPGLIILLVIGIVISALIMSGSMAMLVVWGVEMIHPKVLYLMAFLLPAIFSTFTGTSWGSAATIGVVLLGIGQAIDANLAILGGAIVSGSYFGDKMSPLSDTTNMAAIAAKVNVYDHVQSMIYSTGPSTLICIIFFTVMGFINPPAVADISDPTVQTLIKDLSGMFRFNILLLLPIIIIFVGSYKKYSSIPVMMIGSIVGFLEAGIFQQFTLDQILSSIGRGFNTGMITWYSISDKGIISILERGGYWELAMLLPISISILAFVSILGTIDAMPAVVNKLFGWAESRQSIIIATLASATALIAITANGIACSFVTCDIFGKKYDSKGLDRRILSRTCEDAGTLLEVLFPWTPAAIFFTKTLGMGVGDYLPWSILNLITPVVAIVLAITGYGCFLNKKEKIGGKNE